MYSGVFGQAFFVHYSDNSLNEKKPTHLSTQGTFTEIDEIMHLGRRGLQQEGPLVLRRLESKMFTYLAYLADLFRLSLIISDNLLFSSK